MKQLWICSTLFVVSCAGPSASPAHTPRAPEAEAEPDADVTQSAQPERSAAPDSSALSPAKSARSAQADVGQACEALCVRVAEACSKAAAVLCRARCRQYEKQAGMCSEQLEAALTCQAKVESRALCVPVAASACVQEFRAVNACQKGEAPPEPQRGQPDSAVAAWQRVTLGSVGASVLLPPGSEVDSTTDLRSFRAEHEGVAYFFSLQPGPAGEVTQRKLLRMVLRYVGFRCQKDLRVHGRFDKGERVSVRFDSECLDRSTWQGMLHVWPSKAVVVAFHAPPGVEGIGDPMFYSFETK